MIVRTGWHFRVAFLRRTNPPPCFVHHFAGFHSHLEDAFAQQNHIGPCRQKPLVLFRRLATPLSAFAQSCEDLLDQISGVAYILQVFKLAGNDGLQQLAGGVNKVPARRARVAD